MCKFCDSEAYKTGSDIYDTKRLDYESLSLGILGDFNNELSIIFDSEQHQVKLEACAGIGNDIDTCSILTLYIKYCPICGREL